MKPTALWTLLFLLLVLPVRAVERLNYEVIASYPHDSDAWTQGLYYEEGTLYESTGLYGESTLRRVDLKSGRVLQKHSLVDAYCAEGMTIFNGKLYQLTWLSKKGFIYDPESFEQTGVFAYPTEGWGMTHNASQLIMSDGSEKIRFIDPESMQTVRQIKVRMGGELVRDLNELEYIDGYLFANVWYKDLILKIDPETGQVVGLLDLSKLWPDSPKVEGAVLNGIAYNKEKGVLYVTGKLWSKLFEIKLTQ